MSRVGVGNIHWERTERRKELLEEVRQLAGDACWRLRGRRGRPPKWLIQLENSLGELQAVEEAMG